jgi:hypothetical protein
MGTKPAQKRSGNTRKIGSFPILLLHIGSPLLSLLTASLNLKRNFNFVKKMSLPLVLLNKSNMKTKCIASLWLTPQLA